MDYNTLTLLVDKISVPMIVVGLAVLGIGWVEKHRQRRKKIKFVGVEKTSQDAHGIIFGKDKKKKTVYSPETAEGSVGVFSASGTGKTSAVCSPTLRTWRGNSYTIDISGDICLNCPDIPRKLVFDPMSKENEVVYDILSPIDKIEDLDEKNQALEQLALLLLPAEEQSSDAGKFYNEQAVKIITASFIAFYHQGEDFCDICQRIVDNDYKTLFNAIDATNNEVAMRYIASFVGTTESTIANCLQTASTAVQLFATNSKISKAVRRPLPGEKSLTADGVERYNIFTIVLDQHLRLLSPLLHIQVAQIMQYISSRELTLKTPVILCLDEFASLGKLDILEALRKYRKRRTRCLIMTQNLADLELTYGKEETRAILANLRFKLLLGGLGEVESQEYFANLIGRKDKIKKSHTKSARSSSTTESESREYIIEPADLDKLGDDLIVIAPEGHIRLKKDFYFKR